MAVNKNISYPVSSALFHVVNNLIISRDNISFKVNKIFPDEDKDNLNVNNELRLKKYLFMEISKRYNTRIQHYGLLFNNISKSFLKNFEIFPYKIYQKKSSFSAFASVYPKTFVCKKCDHFISFKENEHEKFEQFDLNNCELGCGGSYEQIIQMKFCEKCGSIVNLSSYCKIHKNIAKWKLLRTDKFQPITWKLACLNCAEENKNYVPKDILAQKCYHNNRSNEDPIRYTLLTATEGSIFHPIVLTTVDIPNPDYDSLYLDYILLGLYLHKFDEFLDREPCDDNDDHKKVILHINDFLDMSQNKVMMKKLDEDTKKSVEMLLSLLNELEDEFDNYSFVNINDHMVLSGSLSKDLIDSVSYNDFIKGNEKLTKEYDSFKKKYKIDQVNYLSNINLVSAVIGLNVGLNKFYEDDFVPHFEPIWDNKTESIKSYVVPFETEGLMFNLDKCEVVNWLIDLGLLDIEYVSDEDFAVNILMGMQNGSEEYYAVKTLIHTLSHILIRRSSLYTGLEEDSCGEMLFVNSASFLIYSSSSINIGGFSFVFENALFDWFEGIKRDIEDCSLDPSCIQETGACFSCLYLPEYVCSEFNLDLDRDVLIGKTDRFSKGFW